MGKRKKKEVVIDDIITDKRVRMTITDEAELLEREHYSMIIGQDDKVNDKIVRAIEALTNKKTVVVEGSCLGIENAILHVESIKRHFLDNESNSTVCQTTSVSSRDNKPWIKMSLVRR